MKYHTIGSVKAYFSNQKPWDDKAICAAIKQAQKDLSGAKWNPCQTLLLKHLTHGQVMDYFRFEGKIRSAKN